MVQPDLPTAWSASLLEVVQITARRFALIIPAMPGILKLSRKAPRISPRSGFGPAGGTTNLAKTKPVDNRKAQALGGMGKKGLVFLV